MPFEAESTPLCDAKLIVAKKFPDNRGFFSELFRKDTFKQMGIAFDVVQLNHSRSFYGVLRGLHLQLAPYEQAKIVYCLRGEIYDVIVDLRKGSPSFGQWFGVRLTESAGNALYVPKGFAHGFQVLSGVADIIYAVDEKYHPESESGIRWDDPDLAIDWPIQDPVLSERDRSLPLFRDFLGT